MPDEITPEERAAIDAAVAQGRVRRIPRGKSAWEIRVNPDTGRLVYVNTETERAEGRARFGFGRRFGSVSATVERRRGRVRALHAEGLTNIEIGARLNVDPRTVSLDLKMLDLPANLTGDRRHTTPEQIAARREKVARMLRDGLRQIVIARKLGVSESAISGDVAALRAQGVVE